jgi:membrane protease subunit HflK
LAGRVEGLKQRALRLANRGGDRGLRRGVLAGALIGFTAGWALSGVYEVRPDQQAVVERLGVVEGVVGPGLHLHLPWPLERVQTFAVTRINTLNLGDATDDGSQALTPTRDGDAADVAYAVQWRIADPIAYLSHLADPQGALKLAAEAAMREAVGATPLEAAMGPERAALQRRIARAIQHRLDRLGAGIAVTGVLIEAVTPPPEVQAAASDVAIARQDADAAVADATAYRARILAEAKANAAKTLVEAQSYRDQTLREAQGAAARFEELDAAYRKAPGVTKDRLYFETLQGVLARAHTLILDPAKGATVNLPPEMLRGAAPPTTASAAATAQPSSRPPSSPAGGSGTVPGVRP